MTGNQKQRLGVVLGVTILAILVLVPTFFKESVPDQWKQKAIKLGLDIRGGSYFVFTVQTEEAVKSHLASIGGTIRDELRKKKAGILRSKPISNRVLETTLLSEDALEPLRTFVRKEYPELINEQVVKNEGNVRVTYEMNPIQAAAIEKEAVAQAIETIRNRVDQFGVAEPEIQRFGEKQIIVQLPDITDVQRVKETIGSVAKLEFRLVSDGKRATDTVSFKDREGGETRVEDEVLMSGDAIERANVDIDPRTNEVAVSLKLNGPGARRFEQVTSENVGKRLAIVLDGVIQSSPNIRERIGGGQAQITGAFTTDEAHRLAVVLRSGALPAPLVFEEGRTVGASLGADAIRRGIHASLAGSILVALFMIVYYRKAGLQAVGCVFLNVIYLLACLCLFGATLTLPGIAGLALTVGMAVDANVLIFERIREELRTGSSIPTAIEAGFNRAFRTIIDANVTHLLVGVILYIFGTGPIKGFAVTLSLGIITSLFSAVYVSKLGFETFRLRDSQGKLSI